MNVEQRLAARYAARQQPTSYFWERTKMTTGKWLSTVFVLVLLGFFPNDTGKVVAVAVVVGGLLASLAVERWAPPRPEGSPD